MSEIKWPEQAASSLKLYGPTTSAYIMSPLAAASGSISASDPASARLGDTLARNRTGRPAGRQIGCRCQFVHCLRETSGSDSFGSSNESASASQSQGESESESDSLIAELISAPNSPSAPLLVESGHVNCFARSQFGAAPVRSQATDVVSRWLSN